MARRQAAPTRSHAASARLNNYDLLRVLATIAVIALHVNYQYFQYHAYEPAPTLVYVAESLVNVVARFSVPAFVMISGGFNLRNERNSDFGLFYRKTTWKIFVPVAVAVLLFAVFDELDAASRGVSLRGQTLGILTAVVYGTYYNLWFMYMLFGLYALTPILMRLKRALSVRTYSVLAAALMVWAVVSQATSTESVPYALGVVFAFLGYYLLGDVILNGLTLRHSAPSYALVSVAAFLLAFVARYMGVTRYLFDAYTSFFSPCIVVASISLFAAFKQVRIGRDLSWISGKTFFVYVFHTLVYTVLFRVLPQVSGNRELVAIPVRVVLTFFIALGIAVAYGRFWEGRAKWKADWYALPIWGGRPRTPNGTQGRP